MCLMTKQQEQMFQEFAVDVLSPLPLPRSGLNIHWSTSLFERGAPCALARAVEVTLISVVVNPPLRCHNYALILPLP